MIGLTAEHRQLHSSARRWVSERAAGAARAALDGDGTRPPLWEELAAQGWLGLHLPEAVGGSGYGLLELACVTEELGRGCVPGPFVPTVVTSAVLARTQPDHPLLAGLADGTVTAAVCLHATDVTATPDGDGLLIDGTARPLLGAPDADLLLLPALREGTATWLLIDAAEAKVAGLAATDATRGLIEVTLTAVRVGPERILAVTTEDVRDLAAVVLAAEAAGVAGWCVEATADYARTRVQFGRPIGQFQAVKHRLADMLVALEQTRALAWDAATIADAGEPEQLRLAAAIARVMAPEAAYRVAKDAIQLHGGIGFTWEHDAHLYLKRALSVRQLLGGAAADRAEVARLAFTGLRRQLHIELDADVSAARAAAQEVIAAIRDLPPHEQRSPLADGGWLSPHYPSPWGRGASPAEQIAIDEEFAAAGIRRPGLMVGAWAVPTLIAHGTPEQQERLIPSTMAGELRWCQLFSEPEAGSDLASLRTRATRVEGGWSITGQKVWTTMAAMADFGICLARSDPDAPKHEGITYFLVDMSDPGVDVRPLTELTGDALFSEVFLTDVFVPDSMVVGAVNGGWRVAKDTLAAERVAMSSGSSFGGGLEALLGQLDGHPAAAHPLVVDEVGHLLCEGQSVSLMNHRATLLALGGGEPAGFSSVRKLLGVEHQQRVSELAMELLGAEIAVAEGEAAQKLKAFLFNRCLTIAGGTSEVQRNVIGERALGLPRLEEPTP